MFWRRKISKRDVFSLFFEAFGFYYLHQYAIHVFVAPPPPCCCCWIIEWGILKTLNDHGKRKTFFDPVIILLPRNGECSY